MDTTIPLSKAAADLQEDIDYIVELLRTEKNELAYITDASSITQADFEWLKHILEKATVEKESLGEILNPFDPSKISVKAKPMAMQQIISRLEHEEIKLDPEFQRAFVWDEGKQCRLIESIILNLPLPAFYFDGKNDKLWEVVDGLQRISTIKRFVVGNDLILKKVHLEFLKQLDGKSYKDLSREHQRRVTDFEIIAYIIEKGTPDEVKYNIFKRINTGGTVLTPQEIRHALNSGKGADFVRDLAKEPAFLEVTGHGIPTARMEDRDFATRFLAFYIHPDIEKDYESDLDSFMSKSMGLLRYYESNRLTSIRDAFVRAMEYSLKIFGNDAFRIRQDRRARRKPINKALFEVLSVSLARLSPSDLARLEAQKEIFQDKLIEAMNDGKFLRSIRQGTAQKQAIKVRFSYLEDIIQETLRQPS